MEISDEVHGMLLDIQHKRKKEKKEPTAMNKIASELLEKAVKKEATN